MKKKINSTNTKCDQQFRSHLQTFSVGRQLFFGVCSMEFIFDFKHWHAIDVYILNYCIKLLALTL